VSETRIAIAIDLRLVSQILYIVWSFGDGEGAFPCSGSQKASVRLIGNLKAAVVSFGSLRI
jgi:hypothetical protein